MIRFRLTYLILAALLGTLLIASCDEPEKEEFDHPLKFNISYLSNAQVASYSDQYVDFKLSITNLQAYYDVDYIEEYVDLDTSNFKFPAGENYSYEITDAEYIPPGQPQPYSLCILMDLSDGYSEFDKNNHRYEAFNGFMQKFNPMSEFVFAGYSRGGRLENEPVDIIGDGFANRWSEQLAIDVLDMALNTGGTSPILEAVDEMIGWIDENASTSNRHILVFAHRDDNSVDVHIDTIIAKAIEKNVKIDLMWYNAENLYSYPWAMAKMAHKTGGMNIYVDHFFRFNTAFLALDRMYRGDFGHFRVTARRIAPPGTFYEGYYFGNFGLSTGFYYWVFWIDL